MNGKWINSRSVPVKEMRIVVLAAVLDLLPFEDLIIARMIVLLLQ